MTSVKYFASLSNCYWTTHDISVCNKMFKHLLTIFSVVCGIRQAFGNCRDTTLDSCLRDQPFDVFILPTEKVCQQLCREDYADKCVFFIYDRVNQICELFDFNEQDFADSCQKVGGTPEPSLVECQQSNDPCSVRYLIPQPTFEKINPL